MNERPVSGWRKSHVDEELNDYVVFLRGGDQVSVSYVDAPTPVQALSFAEEKLTVRSLQAITERRVVDVRDIPEREGGTFLIERIP